MKRLYAPWRSNYTQDTAHTKNEGIPQEQCIFCAHIKENNDEQHFIIKRFEHNFIMLNRFPYNAGHLLIMPFEHRDHLQNVSKDARMELMELATQSARVLKETLDTHGTNIGINLGKASGAGIPSHVHMHVLPRWLGDTNFLPALAETKTISVDLKDIYQRLKTAFEKLSL